MVKATLYLDPVSPWSFFALAVLKRYKPIWNVDLILKPTFLGGVMQASGNKPPLTVKNKGAWMNGQDLPLASDFYALPYTFPTTFPLTTIHATRFLRAVEEKYGDGSEELAKATDAFFAAVWQAPSSLPAVEAIKPENLHLTATRVFSSSEVDELLALSKTENIKDALKTESAKAVEEGAFGFPWIVIERDDGQKRSFFGSDRFEQIAFWLGKEWHGPLPGAKGSTRASKL